MKLVIYKTCGEIDERIVKDSARVNRREYINALLGATTKNKKEKYTVVTRIIYGDIDRVIRVN